MSDTIEDRLNLAYELIQQEQMDEAISILDSILLDDPENADAWWLRANAVSEPEDARHALQKVLDYNPDHEQAKQWLDRLNEVYPPVPEAAGAESLEAEAAVEYAEAAGVAELEQEQEAEEEALPEWMQETLEVEEELGVEAPAPEVVPPLPETPPEIPPSDVGAGEEVPPTRIQSLKTAPAQEEEMAPAVDLGGLFEESEAQVDEGLPSFDDSIFGEPEAEAGAPEKRRSRLRPLLLFALLLVIVLVVAAAVLLGGPGQGPVAAPSPAATEAAAVETIEPSETLQTVLEAAENAANAQAALLGGPATVSLQSRAPGATLVIRVCRPAGSDITAAMNLAMEMAARYGVTVQNELAAVGAELVNCDRDDVLLSAVVPIQYAIAFANGDLAGESFRAEWQWAE